MPRKSVPLLAGHPYHISARYQNAERFPIHMDQMWSLMSDYLYLVGTEFRLNIHSFVLMSNHFHLLVTPKEENLSKALLYLMRESSKKMGRLSSRTNHMWGGRNHKTLIGTDHYFLNCYKYVYQNPIRAGICNRVEEYPYSTLSGLLGLNYLKIPIAEDHILFSPNLNIETLSWLNTLPSKEKIDEIRTALRRSVMAFSTNRKTGRPSTLENELL